MATQKLLAQESFHMHEDDSDLLYNGILALAQDMHTFMSVQKSFN